MSKKPDTLVDAEQQAGVTVAPGRYVVAVSGGVDSMSLLHMLRDVPGLQLVVAHLDHGVRPESADDRQLVQQAAGQYGLPFEYHTVALGPGASEAAARQVRYDFLQSVQQKYHTEAIITAHHQDDVLETACINLARGTGRRGLSALRSGREVVRPLLQMSKARLVAYARQHGLVWREDSTNADVSYLRNKIRREVLPRLTPQGRARLLHIIAQQEQLNRDINEQVNDWLRQHAVTSPGIIRLSRYQLVMLPPLVATQIIQAVSQQLSGNTLLSAQAADMLYFAKAAKPHKLRRAARELSVRCQPGGHIEFCGPAAKPV